MHQHPSLTQEHVGTFPWHPLFNETRPNQTMFHTLFNQPKQGTDFTSFIVCLTYVSGMFIWNRLVSFSVSSWQFIHSSSMNCFYARGDEFGGHISHFIMKHKWINNFFREFYEMTLKLLNLLLNFIINYSTRGKECNFAPYAFSSWSAFFVKWVPTQSPM